MSQFRPQFLLSSVKMTMLICCFTRYVLSMALINLNVKRNGDGLQSLLRIVAQRNCIISYGEL